MRCQQNKCEKEATHRFTWPGQPEAIACEEHATKAERIADAMGMYLHVIQLEPAERQLKCSN